MKILQTPARFIPYTGGTENYVYNLSKELVNLGHRVKVICANEPDAGNDEFDGIKIDRLRYIIKIANTNITPFLPIKIFQEDVDIIHTHLPHPWAADWSYFISRIKKKPCILTYHNDIAGSGIYSYLAKSYNLIFLPLLLKSVKKIIITHKRYIDYSPYLKDYIKKIEVIPIGVDLEQFKVTPQKNRQQKIILFVGLLDEFHQYKGLHYLIRAMDLIKKETSDIKLFIVGEGILKKEYGKLAHSLDLDREIDFIGFLPQEKLAEYYNNCDVFVLPSLSCKQEGFGIVLLEAMACGKPVVTTNITGPAEKIREASAGLIVEPRDSNSLAEALIEILKNKNYAREMGIRARKLVEGEYSWDRIATNIEQLYLGVLRCRE